MLKNFMAAALIIALVLPTGLAAQTDDNAFGDQDGLEVAIARSWMAPLIVSEEFSETQYNEAGTPVSEISWRTEPSSTPIATNAMQTMMLSALIFQFDSADSAAQSLELFNAEQKDQIQRDSRHPATNASSPQLGDKAYLYEGVAVTPNPDGQSDEIAVVYLLVQQNDTIYQIFGVFLPGNHVEISTDIVGQMMDTEASTAPPHYDMSGESSGGLWEKFNAIGLAMPEGTIMTDIEIYPAKENAVRGDSVMMPEVDLDHLGTLPGISGSWHMVFAPENISTATATPQVRPEGVFNIELWIMEFSDPTHATAAALSMEVALTAPLGIISSEMGGFDNENSQALKLVSSGFVQDRSLSRGDAAVVIAVEGSIVYAARVYANGAAPTRIAQELVTDLMAARRGSGPEEIDGTTARGGMWDAFPQPGDDALHGLKPLLVHHDFPAPGGEATPAEGS